MNGSDLASLSVVARVAQERSFTAAADALGVSISSVSYTVRQVEQRVGTRLFNRTTRSVSLTEAGSELLARVLPLMQELDSALGNIGRNAAETTGTLRLNIPPTAVALVITPILKEFLLAYPGIHIDVISDNGLVDIVNRGYDAGIRYGNVLAQDMVAIPLVTGMRFCVVAAPAYLKDKQKPRHPKDLLEHECINYRSPATDALYRWEFEKAGRKLRIAVNGRVATNDNDLLLSAALDGLGFAYLRYRTAEPYLKKGKLVQVLDGWVPVEGLYLYYYNPAGMPPKLRAFIDFARSRLQSSRG